MIINERIKKDLSTLQTDINLVLNNNSLTELQIERFLKSFEKSRYNILNEIKLYNSNVEYNYEKIKTIDNEYSAELTDNILKIYIPEAMPSYKNLKTHAHKRILVNISEITKQFKNLFDKQVCIYIKIFDNITTWDIDNRNIKPIADALISSEVIKDDNVNKMFYIAKGFNSDIPHTEIYVFESENLSNFLDKKCEKK